jgi:hypothetical protein
LGISILQGYRTETADGAALSITPGHSTAYQGIGDFSALLAGGFVNTDAPIQTAGSLPATLGTAAW